MRAKKKGERVIIVDSAGPCLAHERDQSSSYIWRTFVRKMNFERKLPEKLKNALFLKKQTQKMTRTVKKCNFCDFFPRKVIEKSKICHFLRTLPEKEKNATFCEKSPKRRKVTSFAKSCIFFFVKIKFARNVENGENCPF